MRKYLVVFVLVLAVVTLRADDQAKQTQQATHSSKPSPPVPAIAPPQGSSQSAQPAQEKHVDADVRIVSSPGKDSYDKAAFWATIALALVGFVGIGVGIRTLRILKRQTKAAEDATKAALQNTQALINAERAWIMVELEWPDSSGPTQTVSNSGEAITSVPFLLRCFNEGKTPCWVTRKRVCAQIVDSIPEKPEIEKLPPMWTGFDPVRVGKEGAVLQGATGLSGHFREDQTLVIWGVVTYRDAFNEGLETLWGYYCQPKTGGPHLRRISEPAYNRNT
jgi:hypothetical protein